MMENNDNYGSSMTKNHNKNLFFSLPSEILEMILLNIPFEYLCKIQLVCRKFRAFICSDIFLFRLSRANNIDTMLDVSISNNVYYNLMVQTFNNIGYDFQIFIEHGCTLEDYEFSKDVSYEYDEFEEDFDSYTDYSDSDDDIDDYHDNDRICKCKYDNKRKLERRSKYDHYYSDSEN